MTKLLHLALIVAGAIFVQPTSGWTQAAQQSGDSTYTPSPGQLGKDVIWLPTANALVDRMLDMAKVTPEDFLVDLGSGDGRTVITAGRRGVPALGVEYNADLVGFARRNAEAAGVADKVSFVQGDIFQTNFSKATVVTLFLLPELNLRLRPTLLNMKPGTRVVSNTFEMGEWEPDERSEPLQGCASYCRALLWIVPAQVEGTWKMPQGEMKLTQAFQKLAGTLSREGQETPITDATLKGDAISFSARGKSYTGKVSGDSMTFSETAGGTQMTANRAASK